MAKELLTPIGGANACSRPWDLSRGLA